MGYKNALKMGLTTEEYECFKKAGILNKCTPSQPCSWGSAGSVFKSICPQYDIDEVFNSNVLEHKKVKELFLGALFCFLAEQDTKNKYSVGVPFEDRGIDLFVREIDFTKKRVSLLGVQICEFKEKYSKKGLFDFIKNKISRYGSKILSNTLLIWLEPNTELNQAQIEECAGMLVKLEIPFRQIIIMGINESKGILILSQIYSASNANLWAMKFDYNKLEIVEKGCLPKSTRLK